MRLSEEAQRARNMIAGSPPLRTNEEWGYVIANQPYDIVLLAEDIGRLAQVYLDRHNIVINQVFDNAMQLSISLALKLSQIDPKKEDRACNIALGLLAQGWQFRPSLQKWLGQSGRPTL